MFERKFELQLQRQGRKVFHAILDQSGTIIGFINNDLEQVNDPSLLRIYQSKHQRNIVHNQDGAWFMTRYNLQDEPRVILVFSPLGMIPLLPETLEELIEFLEKEE